MKNRRSLKKYVHLVCGALAAGVLETSYEYNCIDKKDVNEILGEIAHLQAGTLSLLSLSYDKSRKEDPAAYRKGRREYFHKSITALMNSFDSKVKEIIAKINSKIPAEVRDSLKASVQ